MPELSLSRIEELLADEKSLLTPECKTISKEQLAFAQEHEADLGERLGCAPLARASSG